MKITVNGKEVKADRDTGADLVLVVPPFKAIPNMPPGYVEHSRWTDGTGTITILARREWR
jgi:hypothetical protein